MTDFATALQKALVHEGGYVNHPRDPGGATMKGVTQAVYDDYRRGLGLKIQTVRYISASELQAIYRQRYWDLIKGDQLPDGVNYVVFDGAINSGVKRSGLWLQKALAPVYTGEIDGLIGPRTIKAIADFNNDAALIDRICDERMAFLRALRTWPTFGKGWSRRVAEVRALGKSWALKTPPISFIEPAIGNDAAPKAPTTDLAPPPPVAPGDAAAYGGGAAATIAQAIGQLQPLQTSPAVANVILWLTVAGVLIATGGFLYRFWAARKRARLAEIRAA